MDTSLIKYCFSGRKPEIFHITDMESYYSSAISELEAAGIIKDIVEHECDSPFDYENQIVRYIVENLCTYTYTFYCNEIRSGEIHTFKFDVKFTLETHNLVELLYVDICSNNYSFTTKSESNCLEILKHQLRKHLKGWENRYCLLDKQSAYYATELYPKIYETENFFRYYVNDVFVKVFGYNWWNEAVANSIKKSREQRIVDTREYSGKYRDIQPYLMSLEWNDLMELANTKTVKWIPQFDVEIEKALNKLSNVDVAALLKQQCTPHLDIWSMCFDKHFSDDFSEKYHLLEKRRNQIAHNKLLAYESYKEILLLCEDVMKGLSDAHRKFCAEFISEEEQEAIEEYKMDLAEQEALEREALDSIAEGESGVKVYSRDEIGDLYKEVMANLYNDIVIGLNDRADIEINEYHDVETDGDKQLYLSLTYKIKNITINIFVSADIDDSPGQSSRLNISFELDDIQEECGIGFINGEYSFNYEQANYMPETQDELDESGIESVKEILFDFIELYFPNLSEEADLQNHLEAMGKDSSITEKDVYCCECGEEYICINAEYAPIGMCLNCGTMNHIIYCTYCSCPVEAVDVGEQDDEQHYCNHCAEKLFGED